jgi:hypothetical protein
MRATVRAVIALATMSALVACDDDTTGPTEFGRLRAVNAVTDVALMDVLFNNASYKTDLAFKASDGYDEVSTGANVVKFREANATTDLHSANVAVDNGGRYTAVAIGTKAAPQSFVLTDDGSDPAAGKIKLRLAHGAATVGAVDIYILANANELANATPVKANLAAKAASEYFVRDAGTYVVIYTTAGTKTALLTIDNLQRAAGSVGTIIAVEKAGGGQPLESILLDDK